MKLDSTTAPKTRKITGTLHTRRHARPAPFRHEDIPGEKAKEGEVPGRHKNISGQDDNAEVAVFTDQQGAEAVV